MAQSMTVGLLGTVAAALCAATLVSCSTTTLGAAVMAPAKSDDPIVALMDTGGYPTKAGPTAKQANWHFKCIAQAGRYAFIAVSDQETDVKQQISAQYQSLAG